MQYETGEKRIKGIWNHFKWFIVSFMPGYDASVNVDGSIHVFRMMK